MASLQFQIHTDKENTVSRGKQTGIVKSGKSKALLSHKTPRRVLGSVNEANRVGGRGERSETVSFGALKPKKVVAEKDKLKQRQQPDKENDVVKRIELKEEKSGVCRSVEPKQTYCLPDIEYMPPPSPPIDDDDILPVKERASFYVHRLLSWRPQCLFGIEPDSDEEDEKEHQRIMAELDNLPLPQDDIFPPADLHLSREELDLDSIELPSMDDISLPFIDEDLEPISGSMDPVLSNLDDSVGLLPEQLGSLQLRDEGLPSTPVL